MKKLIITIILSVFVYSAICAQGTQLLRQPTVSSKSIVFVYANDLWKVDRNGGTAIRLTSNEGYETTPHFSNDEKWIAFTAQYDGNFDVYVIPAEGGSPKRLTWHPGYDEVQGWTPDGKILFCSSREGTPTKENKFYTIGLEGGFPEAIAIPRAAYGEISGDGEYIAYTPIMAWDPEWRNYRGGQAMPIWIVNLKTKELTRTPQLDKERHLYPIWFKNKVYYLSERDYASNIWSYDIKTKQEKQITFHKKFDVKSLDACADAIVYEQGGYLHLLEDGSEKAKQLNIEVIGDMNFSRVRWENVNSARLSNPNISPNGKRAIFEYRGEIFTIPKEDGSWRNITNTPGIADRYPIWSPKGDKVAWFSDGSGEYILTIADQNGENNKKIELPNPTFYFTPNWSPDGKYLAFTDTDYQLWVVDIEKGSSKSVDMDRFAHPSREMNPIWSPDSKWIVYAKQLDNYFKAAFAYNIETGKHIQLTDGMADVKTPVWDQNGKYLYFLASTNYGLNSGWLDMSSYDPSAVYSLYCLILQKETPSPLMAKSDEEEVKKETPETKETSKTKKAEKPTKKEDEIKIDEEGLYQRIIHLNMPARNYLALVSGPENSVFVAEGIPNFRGITIKKFEIKQNKASEFLSGINNLTSSSDAKHILYRKGASWFIADTKMPPSKSIKPIKTNVQIKIDPKAEYEQIFKEGWRFMRDFLYVRNTHGAPWNKIYEWYSPWIRHVRHRNDLNYVVDIMSGEIAVGHSFVAGGDMPDTDNVPIGLLGCDYIIENGHYKISKIYTEENWNPRLKAPLSVPGMNVKEGDYILAVNGISLDSKTNIYSLFEQATNRPVRVMINSTTDKSTAKEILVEPISSRVESYLRTINWVENNRRMVDKLSKGKLAYVYLPSTSRNGFDSFNRYYFAQQDRKGVILDERNNSGGSAADYMIDIMSREIFGYFNSKTKDNQPWTSPFAGIWGPKVMITNERAGSGGDYLPYMFRAKKLGPLVGTRTWGGLVGTWDTPQFIDGGIMVAPRGGFYDKYGNWAVEGEGVAPDIEVIQNPKLVLEGKDPQLIKAVETALELLKEKEVKLKPEPKAPIHWKRPKGFKIN